MPKKKIVKKKTLKNTPEKERHFGVILEDINSNIHLVIERQDILDRKIDVFKSEMNDFKSGTESNFKTVFGYLDRIDNELQEIRAEIKELKQELSKKAELSRLENLEKRVKNMELIIQKKLVRA